MIRIIAIFILILSIMGINDHYLFSVTNIGNPLKPIVDTLYSEPLFPLSKGDKSFNSCNSKKDFLQTIEYGIEGDTFIECKGIWNCAENADLYHDTTYRARNSSFPKSKLAFERLFPLEQRNEQSRINQYYKVYFTYKEEEGGYEYHSPKIYFYLRKLGNSYFFMIVNEQGREEELFQKEQVFFDFDMKKGEKWLIEGAPIVVYDWVELKGKSYNKRLSDTLYDYYFEGLGAQYYNEASIEHIYVSKKYGFVGFGSYIAKQTECIRCETWYYPYFGKE